MAKRLFSLEGQSWNNTAQGVAATTWQALKGGAATQIIDILEVLVSGMAASSIPSGFTLGYSSTLGVTPTTLASPGFDGPMVVNATALGSLVIAYFAAATGPIPAVATTLPKLNLGLNAFGGILRWNAAPTQQWTMIGNTTNGGETVLWNNTTAGSSATAAANAHIMYEPY